MRTFAFITLVSTLFACSTPVRDVQDSKPVSIKAPSTKAVESKQADRFKVSNLGATTENGVRFITGDVVNNSGATLSYIQVSINLLDKSGAVVGSTMANANNIEQGQKWKFKALLTEETARTFVVTGVTGF